MTGTVWNDILGTFNLNTLMLLVIAAINFASIYFQQRQATRQAEAAAQAAIAASKAELAASDARNATLLAGVAAAEAADKADKAVTVSEVQLSQSQYNTEVLGQINAKLDDQKKEAKK